jgi:aspartyl-tRNA(Asn)/glutamyl-tRNA(Gln) amidotransferase subunit B
LPAFNPEVAQLALKCGLALHCRPTLSSVFERKHYFYPDIPKNFQLTQNEIPIASGGWLALRTKEGEVFKRTRVRKVHMEEDAAKNVHVEGRGVRVTLVDFNRCGTPLLEIVSEPDLASPEEATIYLEHLQRLVRWYGLSSANMEAGEMRCDANISIRPADLALEDTERWEIKNVNSIRFAGKALEVAQKAQIATLLANPHKLPRELFRRQTFGYEEKNNKLVLHRTKETADDYFYFEEPDLRDVHVTDEMVAEAQRTMRPDLDERQDAMLTEGLPWQFVQELTSRPGWYDYWVAASRVSESSPKAIANWMMRDLLNVAKGHNEIDIPIAPSAFAAFVRAAESGQIVTARAREVLDSMWSSGETEPLRAAERVGQRAQEIADGEIEKAVRELVERNPAQAQRVLEGETKLVNFFIGQTIQRFQLKVNARKVTEIVRRVLCLPPES